MRLAWFTDKYSYCAFCAYCRRRIYTEEKAKVVAAVWGTELIKFLAALVAILNQADLKITMNWSFSSYLPSAIHPYLHIILHGVKQLAGRGIE